MKCIIVDDEPLARKGIKMLTDKTQGLVLLGEFGNAESASLFLDGNEVDLVFLDIQMPGTNGIELAKTIGNKTLVIFTTAYAEYALDSYEVDAVDYLVKPVSLPRFQRAVAKAKSYAELLSAEVKNKLETVEDGYIFIKADRKIIRIYFTDILFIEGLKDYVIIHTPEQKIVALISLKAINSQLPSGIFFRVNKSYIVNTQHISSLNNNDIQIGRHEIPIGNTYRNEFFERFVSGKLLN
ncbi:MAG: LytTR family DNA-binding domain-containing protein [Prevotellaceae bacterium]|jgi:DNA-binding LytR/AlgR family response regulator|nr:LytTR family DNA-binding domain-containing protein [Prevotellaceae bacterium]